MNLLEKLAHFFGFKYTPVYCQQCNKNITHQGGYITPSRKVYCQDDTDNSCITQALKEGKEKRTGYRFATTNSLQQAIEKETIRHYGPLEKKTEN